MERTKNSIKIRFTKEQLVKMYTMHLNGYPYKEIARAFGIRNYSVISKILKESVEKDIQEFKANRLCYREKFNGYLKQQGLSVLQFCKLNKIDTKAVYNYVNGGKIIRKTAQKISDITGIPTDELIHDGMKFGMEIEE